MSDDLVQMNVADLTSPVFVRRELDEDRVLQFMEIYRSNDHELPPVEVFRGTTNIKEGRHRREALHRLDRKTTMCKLVKPPVDTADFLMQAFEANFGGPLPPKRVDIIYVIRQLIEEGLPDVRIREIFSEFYSISIARAYVKEAHREIDRAKMRRAVAAVAAGGTTAYDAAALHGVDAGELQSELTGRKRQGRKHDIGGIKGDISNRIRANSTRNVKIFKDLKDRYSDGEVSYDKVLEVMLHTKKTLAESSKRIDGWIERLDAQRNAMKKAK